MAAGGEMAGVFAPAVDAAALRSTVPVGPRVALPGRGAAAGGGGDAGGIDVAAIRYPQATQKRTLGWLLAPQLEHVTWLWGGAGVSVRGAKLIWGAGGRCGKGVGRRGGSGARAVAARGDSAAGGTPKGGVGATTRGKSL